ncbi:hypothetical protein GCM10007860_35380 [Chitiniphilus shinanonensis]|uniref:Carrier domain-containing protein n=1 Tax=Chitiniphilus shinanonensis TaxID=553088 RepID=A0ABQ6C2W4_9NEIS|nr:acyl carrier protein [Chitiniphilus shinanonensis]GLS06354.1 hypothetical protein GCM10007860_35380 [Chitiniphilus shinanonensis]
MTSRPAVLAAFCDAVNALKKTALDPERIDPALYLGGDLGIDSIEMLEIWFRIERAVGGRIPDDAKRDIYTVGEVADVVAGHCPAVTA